jgi:CubicO group peptidase (beta-lactamase class C family)
MSGWVVKGSLLLLVVAVLFSLTSHKFIRLYNVITLFDEHKIVQNFRNMCDLGFPCRVIQRGEKVAPFLEGSSSPLPTHFTSKQKTYNVMEYLKDHNTTALIVLHALNLTSAKVLYEEYFLGNDRESLVISWSTVKSIVSTLVGIALEEGKIRSLNDAVSDYVPELQQSGYKEVKLKNVIQMSSGVSFNENYFDFYSDINVLGRALALGYSLNQFAASLVNERPPGTYNHYVSMDTQVLGMVVMAATNRTLSDYLHHVLWKRLGTESNAKWILDNDSDQMEMAFGGLMATSRDFARFGWLFLNEGKSPVDGSTIISEKWVREATVPEPNAKHLQPGENDYSDYPFGYGYQWWIPGREDAPHLLNGDYLAIGVYNQFIYISPKYQIVIVRNSAFAHYEKKARLSEEESISLFRTIAQHYSQQK